MYDIIEQMIGHTWTTGDSAQQYIFYACVAVIIVLTAVVLDLVYRVFSHFFRG